MVANLPYAQNMGHVGSLQAELKVHVMHRVCGVVCCIFMVLIDLCSSGGYLLCIMRNISQRCRAKSII